MNIMKYILLIIIGLLIAVSCSSLTPLQRQELKQARYEAQLARIKADTLSIQRTNNTYRNTGWNLWWNDPLRYNGWYNNWYSPRPIIITKRKRNGNTNNRNVNPVRGRRGSTNANRVVPIKRNQTRTRTTPNIQVRPNKGRIHKDKQK